MTHTHCALDRSLRLGAAIALAALMLPVPGSLAQDEVTPTGGGQTGDGPHPAHIHAGTCEELGDVVIPLTEVAEVSADAQRMGPASAHAVKSSVTVVDMPLQEIIDGGHAINVHLSADEIDVYIACGDIGGHVIEDEEGRQELRIGLVELNDSGHFGIAELVADGEETEVAVHLVEREAVS
jgi:hypothetical protein